MPESTFADKFIKLVHDELSVILSVVRRCEEFLGPGDDWVEDDRRILYEAADSVLRPLGRQTVREKGVADYITTVHADSDVVETALHNGGYNRNVLSTRKYRTHHGGGEQWAVGSWVYDPPTTDWQHHVYLFDAEGGGTDMYGHRETSVRDPDGHLNDRQTHGDPNGRARKSVERHNLDYSEKENL